MQEIYEFLKKCNVYYIATIDGDRPRLRAFGTIDMFDNHLTIQTGKVKDVSKQIHINPNIAICAFDGQKWLRINAKAVEEENLEAQAHMLAAYPELQGMYKVNDGNNEIFRLTQVEAIITGFGIEPKRYNF